MNGPAFRQVSLLLKPRLSTLAPRCNSLRINRYLPVDLLTSSMEGAAAVGMVAAAPAGEEPAWAVQVAAEVKAGQAALVAAAPEAAEVKVAQAARVAGETAALLVTPLATQTTLSLEQSFHRSRHLPRPISSHSMSWPKVQADSRSSTRTTYLQDFKKSRANKMSTTFSDMLPLIRLREVAIL